MEKQSIPEKEILKKIRKIQIRTKRLVNDAMSGEYQSAFRGRGMEFDLVREYYEGDDPRSIDWNVTARMGYPYVKSFVEERELTIMLVVDISASTEFGTTDQLKKEQIAEFCAVLAFNAIKKNDRVGLILFSDQIELYVPPKKGRTHVYRIIRELLYFKAVRQKTSLNTSLEFLNKVLKKRSVVFLVSDFYDQNYIKNLLLTNQRHDLVAVESRDVREYQIPKCGLITFEDHETGQLLFVDSNSSGWRDHFYHITQKRMQNIKEQFRQYGIDHLIIETGHSFEHDLIMFFKQR